MTFSFPENNHNKNSTIRLLIQCTPWGEIPKGLRWDWTLAT